MDEPSRRFETDETSRKDPQDASELTKRPGRNPQDASELTKRPGRNPQDASELTKRPEGMIRDFDMNFGSVLPVPLDLDQYYQLLVPIFRIGSVTVPLSPILDLDLDQ
ncbi:unnamed protein product [Rhizophagus irregularis]|nr:unnamed protein product [Rhizophagus irregularis]